MSAPTAHTGVHAAHDRPFTTRQPEACWPVPLLDLYRSAYQLHNATQLLWRLTQAAAFRNETLTRAYHTAFDALDQVEWEGDHQLRAWLRAQGRDQ